MSATTCTNHCSQCGRHFHSLEAFDIHHQRDETGWPQCLDPIDLEDRDGKARLVALTHDGECRMYAEPTRGITIWVSDRGEHPEARKRRLASLAQAERPALEAEATP